MLMTDMNSRCKTNHNLFEFNSIKLMITITNLQHVELYFFYRHHIIYLLKWFFVLFVDLHMREIYIH